jgi:hypothetical protein
MQLTSDGKMLAVRGYSRTGFYDLASGKLDWSLRHPTLGLYSNVSSSRLSPDGKRITFLGAGQVLVVSLEDGEVIRAWPMGGYGHSLRYSSDGRHLIAASHSVLQVWDEGTGKANLPVVGDFGSLGTVEVSPDGRWIATAGNATVLLWDSRILRRSPVYRLSADEWEACWNGLATRLEKETRPKPWLDLLHAAGDDGVARIRERLGQSSFDLKSAERLLREIRPLLRDSLDGKLDEVKRGRIETVLRELAKFEDDEYRAPHVVFLLQQFGSKQARALLADMAAGKFGDVWQKAAKAKR